MKTVGLFYGSETGNTESAAAMIAAELGQSNVEMYNIADSDPQMLLSYDNIILGASTWGFGELQSDWENFLPGFDQLDLSGKTVALFGLGDQINYADVFLDAMGTIYEKVRERGGTVVGSWSTEGYDFSASTALANGSFVGLALDVDNQDDMTPDRVSHWVSMISSHLQ